MTTKTTSIRKRICSMLSIGVLVVVFSGAGFAPLPAPTLSNPYIETDFSQGLEVVRLVSAKQTSALNQADFSTLYPDVNRFYAATGYALAWTVGWQPTPRALELIQMMQDARALGLDPVDYETEELALWVRRGNPLTTKAVRAEFDVALTVAGLRYARDLRFGKVNPGVYDVGKTRRSNINLGDLFRRHVIDSVSLAEGILHLEPPHAEYQRLLKALADYRELAQRRAGAAAPPAVYGIIEAGDPYAGIAELTAFLMDTGDLNAEQLLPELEALGADIYTQPLVEAVKRFQARHGLAADGRLGPATIAALRTPIDDRVRQLELALERWRWLPHDFARAPIMVNIPEYRLRAMTGPNLDQAAWETRVVVGSAGRSTPAFGDEMEYLMFSPYWNVTPNITRNELVPQLEADPTYLRANRYEVYTWQGEVVTRDQVTPEIIAKLRAGVLGIRQIPGAGNALGGVKFIFPNARNIYLHDTPSKYLFDRDQRAFSHGCVRVEHPEQLAAWALNSETHASEKDADWTPAAIQSAMHRTTEQKVKLDTNIPVLLVYHTATVAEDGKARFFEDIYGYDRELEAELNSSL